MTILVFSLPMLLPIKLAVFQKTNNRSIDAVFNIAEIHHQDLEPSKQCLS